MAIQGWFETLKIQVGRINQLFSKNAAEQWGLNLDIDSWLRSLGLGQYEAAFRENNIDDAVLTNLTVEDLKELGVASPGHRRKLLDAIAALRADVGDWRRQANWNANLRKPLASVDISPCCSAIYLVRPASLPSSTPRTGAIWSARI